MPAQPLLPSEVIGDEPLEDSVPSIDLDNLDLSDYVPELEITRQHESANVPMGDRFVPMHNVRPPQVTVQTENTTHRAILWMKIQGQSNRTIAQQLRISEGWVSQVTRQKWFLRQMALEMDTVGRDTTEAILQSAANDCMQQVIALSTAAKSEAVRLAASNSLLDRFLGKPVQRTQTEQHVHHHKASDQIDELDAQIADLEKQEAALSERF